MWLLESMSCTKQRSEPAMVMVILCGMRVFRANVSTPKTLPFS